MMEQYQDIKAAHPDCLLFYRMGDFYELFFADAEVASRALGIVLTKRGKHLGADIPMCGVPIERADEYLHRLIAQTRLKPAGCPRSPAGRRRTFPVRPVSTPAPTNSVLVVRGYLAQAHHGSSLAPQHVASACRMSAASFVHCALVGFICDSLSASMDATRYASRAAASSPIAENASPRFQ